MNIIYVYPGNEIKGSYSGDSNSVRDEFVKDLGRMNNEKFVEACFKIEAIATTPRNIERDCLTIRANSNYDLTDIFEKIKEMGSENVSGIILAQTWNESNFRDFGSYGARNDESKEEIILGIIAKYPELAGRFVTLNFMISQDGKGKYATEFFSPICEIQGNTCRMIQHFSNLRNLA